MWSLHFSISLQVFWGFGSFFCIARTHKHKWEGKRTPCFLGRVFSKFFNLSDSSNIFFAWIKHVKLFQAIPRENTKLVTKHTDNKVKLYHFLCFLFSTDEGIIVRYQFPKTLRCLRRFDVVNSGNRTRGGSRSHPLDIQAFLLLNTRPYLCLLPYFGLHFWHWTGGLVSPL